jgi:hypothetical protein
MANARRIPVVPLEAGGGPENPPCPACGEPLFGWLPPAAGLRGPVRRCESCGLGVVSGPGEAAEALAALDGLGEPPCFANRESWAASLAGPAWAALEPGARYLFTVEAVRRLAARRDQIVARARWAPGRGVAIMAQTLLNTLTFGRNVGLGALGRGRAAPAPRPWQRRIDGLITLVLALPTLIVALPIELCAGLLGRGAAVRARLELL